MDFGCINPLLSGMSPNSTTPASVNEICDTGSPRSTRLRSFDSNTADGSNDEPCKRSKSRVHREERLACPFFKHDPAQHWDCVKAAFKTWAHTKQHLKRKHYLCLCPHCNKDFAGRETRDQHIVNCFAMHSPAKPPRIIDKISEESQAIIDTRTRGRRLSDKDRWNVAWDIIFPGTERPFFPYTQDPRIALREHFLGIMMTRPLSFDLQLLEEGHVNSKSNLDVIINRMSGLVRDAPISLLTTGGPQINQSQCEDTRVTAFEEAEGSNTQLANAGRNFGQAFPMNSEELGNINLTETMLERQISNTSNTAEDLLVVLNDEGVGNWFTFSEG